MLQIIVQKKEFFNEKDNTFINFKGQTIQLEHSLVSISKWESKWKKPFLSSNPNDRKTDEEIIDYIKCMTITQNVDPLLYLCLSKDNYAQITNYIDDSMTATRINSYGNIGGHKEILTSELIYYYMFSLGIPKELEKWHLNRLITLIRVFSIKNEPKKRKMSKKDVSSMYRELNEKRKRDLRSTG